MKHPQWDGSVLTLMWRLWGCLLPVLLMAAQVPAVSQEWTAHLVKEIKPPYVNPTGYASPRWLTPVGGALFFTDLGGYLWRSDGTEAGTVMLKKILPGMVPGTAGCHMVEMNGTLYFIDCEDGTHAALGKSDGTPTGTVRIKELGTYWGDLLVSDGTLWFCTSVTDSSLWKSDGTSAGTVQVRSFSLGSGSAGYALTVYHGLFYFVVKGKTDTAWQFWKSDGTWAGTTLVKNLPCPASSLRHPGNAYIVNDRLLFFTEDASGVIGLWRSDGTGGGTQLIMPTITTAWQGWFPVDFSHDIAIPIDYDLWASSVGTARTVVFGVYNDTSTSVWKTDGTPGGTTKLTDVGGAPSAVPEVFPIEFTHTGDGIYFFTVSYNSSLRSQQCALWKTDASVGHVTQVKAFTSIYTRRPGYAITSTANIGGTVIFGLQETEMGARIWTSDGTSAGTTPIPDSPPASTGSLPWYFTNVHGRAFCSAYDTVHKQQLWACMPGPPPTAAFAASRRSGAPPLTVDFTDLSDSYSPITDWEWDFGDGQTSSERNPSHVFSVNGVYTVTLTVTSPEGVDVATYTWYIEIGDVLPATMPPGTVLLAAAVLAVGAVLLRSFRIAAYRD